MGDYITILAWVGIHIIVETVAAQLDYLILKESDFSCIRIYSNIGICDFNNFSDHAASYVTIDEHNSEHVVTSYKWNNEKRDTFRSGIIAKLPLFNVLLNNIVTNSSDVEELVSHFARAISDVEILYLRKQHILKVYIQHIPQIKSGLMVIA